MDEEPQAESNYEYAQRLTQGPYRGEDQGAQAVATLAVADAIRDLASAVRETPDNRSSWL